MIEPHPFCIMNDSKKVNISGINSRTLNALPVILPGMIYIETAIDFPTTTLLDIMNRHTEFDHYYYDGKTSDYCDNRMHATRSIAGFIEHGKGRDHNILPQTSTIEGAGHVMVPVPKCHLPEGTIITGTP